METPIEPTSARSEAGAVRSEDAGRGVWRDAGPVVALGGAALLLVGAFTTAVLTAPRPDHTANLGSASALLEGGDHRRALEVLNDQVLPYEGRGLSAEQTRQFHLLRARSLYLGQRAEGLDVEANHRAILGEYAAAAGKAGVASLEPRDLAYLADTHISLNELAPALETMRRLPGEEKDRRAMLVKRIVERKLSGSTGYGPGTAILLADLLDDDQLDADSRAWVVARQGELLIDSGNADEAVAKLLRAMPRVADAKPAMLGELFLLLGRGYLDLGAVGEAATQVSRAEGLLPSGSPQRGGVLLARARIAEAEGDISGARAGYQQAAQEYEGVRIDALLGLAEVLAASGETAESAGVYATIVGELKGKAGQDRPRAEATRSLLARHENALMGGRVEESLGFARLAEELNGREATPTSVLLALARSHRRMAEGLLGALASGVDRALELSRMEAEPRERARRSLREAGRYYRRHAERMAGGDQREYGESLWLAADSLDLAGEHDEAIVAMALFANDFANDPRQVEARFRLAQAYQARGDYAGAADYYRGLIGDGEGRGAGPFADASYVPLARTYLSDADPTNDGEAERLLVYVVEGNLGGTATMSYRDAVWELARLRVRQGRYAEAVERLEELLTRAPDHRRVDAVRYDLADACRLEAAAIAETLESALPDAERRALEAARVARLRRASELFETVRASLEREDSGGATLTPLEAMQLRNSWFFLGDCAFDLGDFESSRRLYDAARERYPEDPASLVAMIQIVNSYLEEGDLGRAATANERARRFYQSLPDRVWEDPTLPIDRGDWQRWLDSIAALTPRETEHASWPSEVADEP